MRPFVPFLSFAGFLAAVSCLIAFFFLDAFRAILLSSLFVALFLLVFLVFAVTSCLTRLRELASELEASRE